MIENITKMIREPHKALLMDINEYDITEESWIFEQAKFMADEWIRRYEDDPRGDWAQKHKITDKEDIFKKMVGLFGEYVVEGVLDQFVIPHNWANPMYPRGDDPRGNKPWDQLIASNLTLEVKTNPPFSNYGYLIMDEASNMHCQYVLGIQLFHEEGKNLIDSFQIDKDGWNLEYLKRVKIARLAGFLIKEDVDALECKDYYGLGNCRRWSLNALRPMNLFWITILQYSSDEYYRDLAREIIAKNTKVIDDVIFNKTIKRDLAATK